MTIWAKDELYLEELHDWGSPGPRASLKKVKDLKY